MRLLPFPAPAAHNLHRTAWNRFSWFCRFALPYARTWDASSRITCLPGCIATSAPYACLPIANTLYLAWRTLPRLQQRLFAVPAADLGLVQRALPRVAAGSSQDGLPTPDLLRTAACWRAAEPEKAAFPRFFFGFVATRP